VTASAAISLAFVLYIGMTISTVLIIASFNNANAQVIELPQFIPSVTGTPFNSTSTSSNENSSPASPPPSSLSSPAAVEQQPSEGNGSSNQPERQPNILPNAVHSTNPCVTYDEESHTIEIVCNTNIVDLYFGLRDDSILEHQGSDQLLIKSNITVDEDATLSINADGGIRYLKIIGNNGITVYGKIQINGVKITSWNTIDNAVIQEDSSGTVPRAYLFLSGSEGSYIVNSEFGYMGYNNTGSRGVDLLNGAHDFQIRNSTFHDMWYAFYSNAAYDVLIDSSEYMNNYQYGIDPHTGTHDLKIINNRVHDNPIGIVCSLDCYNIIFENNTVYNNSGSAIFFSRNTHDSVARYNNIYNQQVGIAFSESYNNEAYGNNITSTGRAIFLNNPEDTDDGVTTNNRIYNNTIKDVSIGVSAIRATGNVLASNHFYNVKMDYYRLNASSSLMIDNQEFENATIAGQFGQNIVHIVNSGTIKVDGTNTYDTELQYDTILSNQTLAVNSVSRE
jgi:hypothetical protein